MKIEAVSLTEKHPNKINSQNCLLLLVPAPLTLLFTLLSALFEDKCFINVHEYRSAEENLAKALRITKATDTPNNGSQISEGDIVDDP